MSNPILEELELQKFRNWLNGKPQNEVVGEARRSACCPVAQYLTSAGWSYVSVLPAAVSGTILGMDYRVCDAELPGWLIPFVDSVDTCNDPVTAFHALHILNCLQL